MNQVQNISFHGQTVPVFTRNQTHYVAMKPIVENIGLDWVSQHKKIQRNDILKSGMVMMTIPATDGKTYETACLPLDYLNGWLFGVDAKRVKPEIRERLLTYQRECFRVLNDHFNRPREQLTVPAIPDPFRIKEEDARHEMQKIFFTIESALHDNGVMHPDTFRDYSHGKTGKRVISLNFWKMSLVIRRIIEDIPKMVIDRSPEVRRLIDEARYDLNCDALPAPEENQSAAPKKPADSSDAQCRKREIAESHKSAIARLLTYDGDKSAIGLAECAAANEIINLSRVVSDAYENFMFSNENQNLTDEDLKCAMLELARLKNTVMELSCC